MQQQHDGPSYSHQPAAVCLIKAVRPDPNTRPETRLHSEEGPPVLLRLLGARSGTGIDRRAGSHAAGLLRLKRSMPRPSASAITCEQS